jgi:hypothetical protein
MRRSLVAVALAVSIMACGGDPPSSPPASEGAPPIAPAFALACWDVPVDDCDRIALEGVARLPAGGPVVVAASVRGPGRLIAEFADGRGLAQAEWSLEPGEPVVFGAWGDVPAAEVRPASGPMLGPVLRYSLGHCGLDSPIDVDGALWDPAGAIDAGASEAINAADGEFRRTGVATAEFVAPSGFRVMLVRHAGRKSLPLCD